MFFYIIVILVTTLLFYLCEHNSGKNISFLQFSIFVLFPSVIEGCRDVTVGQDMQVYGVEFFINAKYSHSFNSFIKSLYTNEYAYHILNYICSRFGEINLFLFVAAAIKMTLVGLTALHFRKTFPSWILILCYLLFFYVYEFSLMRQGMALAVCFYGLTFFFEKKFIPFYVCVFVAYLFHSSAVFMFFLYPVHIAVKKWPQKITLYVIFILSFVYFTIRAIYNSIANLLLFSEDKIEGYFDSGVKSSKTCILIAVSLFFISYIIRVNEEFEYKKIMARMLSIISLFFLLLCYFIEVAFRISFYFLIPSLILTFSYLCIANIKHKMIYLYIISVFFLHIFISAIHGLGGTIPYKSEILGI